MRKSDYVGMNVKRRRVLKSAAVGATLPFLGSRAFAGPAQADTITVGSALDIFNFDPYRQYLDALLLLRNLNAWLLNYDDQLGPQPAALENYTISDDRTRVTLRIRPDVVFQTGRTMTVDDVLFAFDRASDPERGFNVAAATTAIVESFEGLNDRELVLNLREPTSTSLITDLLVGQPVVDASKNDAGTLSNEAASAGPYRVIDWRQGESLRLEAFPEWFGGSPRTPNVEFRFFTAPAAATNALVSGAIDVLAYPTPRDAARLQDGFDILSGYPGAATMLLRVSTKTPPFDDRIVRQALQRVINRDRIVDEVLFGFGGAAYLPWGPNSPANDSSMHNEVAYDLDGARELLSTSTSNMSGVGLVSGSDPTGLLVMQMIQADLASIGFDLEIEQSDPATYGSRLVSGDFGIGLGQVGGGQLSVPRIVQNSLMRTSNNPLWPDGIPPEGYSRNINTLVGAEDPAVRQAAYDELNRTLIDESWAIATYDVPTLFASDPDLMGLQRDHQNALVLAYASF